MTALHAAAAGGQLDVAEYLISKGADVNARAESNGHSTGSRTPLHLAVLGSHADLVELLIEKGADVNATDLYLPRGTPLYYAKTRGHTEIVELLKKHGAKE